MIPVRHNWRVGHPNEEIFSKVATEILRRDGYACVYCGNIANVIDHVIPFSKGGKTIKANGVACCSKCNHKKKGSLIEEFLVKGLVHLAKMGEDISWVDALYTKKLKEPTEIEIYYIEKMVQDGLEPSEISQLLGIDVDTIKEII